MRIFNGGKYFADPVNGRLVCKMLTYKPVVENKAQEVGDFSAMVSSGKSHYRQNQYAGFQVFRHI